MEDFVTKMPKIELHAHLNGSLTTESLLELGAIKYDSANKKLDDFKEHFQNLESLDEAFTKFKIVHDLTDTKPTLRQATLFAIRDFAKDNVIYIELRTTPKHNDNMSKMEYLQCVLDAIRTAQKELPQIIVKLLPSIDRSQGVESAKSTAEVVFKLLPEYKDIIKGIDLSGNPRIEEFSTYKPIFTEFKMANLQLALHCGEIDNDQEVKEMIEFGMARCGHGTFVKGKNLEMLMEKRIPVECCLSSNVKCATVPSFDDHHFNYFLKNQYPVCICTDDFGVFDTTLSNEFIIAQKTFNLTETDFKALSMNAILASFASSDEQLELRRKVENYFSNEIKT